MIIFKNMDNRKLLSENIRRDYRGFTSRACHRLDGFMVRTNVFIFGRYRAKRLPGDSGGFNSSEDFLGGVVKDGSGCQRWLGGLRVRTPIVSHSEKNGGKNAAGGKVVFLQGFGNF